MKQTSEAAFEIAIEAVLLGQGYTRVDAKGFDRERAIFPERRSPSSATPKPRSGRSWRRCTGSKPASRSWNPVQVDGR